MLTILLIVFSQYFKISIFSISRLKIPPGCTTELNHNAYLFLQSVFDKHDKVNLACNNKNKYFYFSNNY